MKILFISWDGPQVSYLEGLFLPIFAGLRKHGIEFHVLQFTWADKSGVARTHVAYEAAGVGYTSVRVWRRPIALGAVLTAAFGAVQIARHIRRFGIDVVMPRSILPAFATMLVRGIGRMPIVFDADGLAIDERVDFVGELTSSMRYRVMREIEVEAVRRAVAVVTRTPRAAQILQARAGAGTATGKFHIVGNGRDPLRFHPFDNPARARVRTRLGIPLTAPLLVYSGSLGEQYCPVQMLQLFAFVLRRRSDARLLILSTEGQSFLKLASEMGVPEDALTVMALNPREVPEHLACADVGLALRMPSFSTQGVAPIKLGEYLLCGVPVVVSNSIGNAELVGPDTGMSVNRIDRAAMEEGADWVADQVLGDREGFRKRCVALGRTSFSLDRSVEEYLLALSTLKTARCSSGGWSEPISLPDPGVS